MNRLFTLTKTALAAAMIGAVMLMWLGSSFCPEDDLVCVFTWAPRS